MKILLCFFMLALAAHCQFTVALLRADSLYYPNARKPTTGTEPYSSIFTDFFSAVGFHATLGHVIEGSDPEPCPDDRDVCGDAPNSRPIIGVLTQPAGNLGPEITPHKPHTTVNAFGNNLDKTDLLSTHSHYPSTSNSNNLYPQPTKFGRQPPLEHFYAEEYTEYIAASYVKWLEAAGARVVAVRFNQSKADLLTAFSKLNGLLLPGGGTPLMPKTDFFLAGQALWEYLNDHDPSFPVFGTCLGFEFLSCLFTDTNQSLVDSGDFDAENISWPLTLTDKSYDSTLLKTSLENSRLRKAIETKNLTYNSHTQGLTPEIFYNTKLLNNNFNVLATGRDKNDKKFIAAIESSKESKFENIFGVQFHPEKSIFEWFVPSNIPHCRESIELAQNLANSFVDVARKRTKVNSFEGGVEAESKKLIENEQRLFLGNFYFSEVFVWKKENKNTKVKHSETKEQNSKQVKQTEEIIVK